MRASYVVGRCRWQCSRVDGCPRPSKPSAARQRVDACSRPCSRHELSSNRPLLVAEGSRRAVRMPRVASHPCENRARVPPLRGWIRPAPSPGAPTIWPSHSAEGLLSHSGLAALAEAEVGGAGVAGAALLLQQAPGLAVGLVDGFRIIGREVNGCLPVMAISAGMMYQRSSGMR